MLGLESIKDDLINLSKEYFRLCELLGYEEVLLDKKLSLHLEKNKQHIENVVLKYQKYKKECQSLEELNLLKNQVDDSEKQIFEDEQKITILKIKGLEEEISKLYISLNSKMQNIVIEVVKNKEESAKQLFKDLILGYTKFCESNNLSFELDSDNDNAKINVTGLNAKEFFKNEIGVHFAENDFNVGSCQVFVYDSMEENFFDEKDLSIISCRSSGAGGQHINTTDSAIKVTHITTGISAICQDERSQFQNKQKAIERVKEKVLNYYAKQKNQMIENQKKQQLKISKKNKYIKIYNYKKGIVKNGQKEFLIKDFLLGKVI